MTDDPFAQDTTDGCTLRVRIHPAARRNAVTGLHDGALKISLITPPVEGRANEALIAFVSEALRLPKARVALVAGMTSRSKVLRIEGKSAAEVQAALSPAVDC